MESSVTAALRLAFIKYGAALSCVSCVSWPAPSASASALEQPVAVASSEAPAAKPSEPAEAVRRQPWREGLWATWNSLRGDEYALDEHGRFLEQGQRPECSAQELVRYRGDTLRYSRAVYVHPAFRERLKRFEQVVVEVAQEVYGRAPTRLRHAGAFSCRTSRQRSHRLSEHALGNAIDVVGFDFAVAPRKQPPHANVPKALRRPFQVRVVRHWQEGKEATAALHREFLHRLAARLEDRDDVFRVMIGPSQRDHHDHFHFDMSPWRYVRF